MALDKFQPYLFVSAGEQSNKLLTPTYADGIAQFQAQRAQSLTGLTVRIDPIQEGTGDPSPTNIRPISGRTGLTVTRAGKNLAKFADEILNEDRTQNGVTIHALNESTVRISGTATGNAFLTDPQSYEQLVSENHFYKAGTYTMSSNLLRNASNYAYSTGFEFDGTPISGNIVTNVYDGHPVTFTMASDFYANIQMSIRSGSDFSTGIDTWVQIEPGSTATAYEPYAGQAYPVTWETEAGTVYGGTLDMVSGVLTVDRAIATITRDVYTSNWFSHDASYSTWGFYCNNDTRWTDFIGDIPIGGLISDRFPTVLSAYASDSTCCSLATQNGVMSYMAFRIPKTAIATPTDSNDLSEKIKIWLDSNPIQVCFEIEPQTYQLTGAEVRTITGFNQIYSDAGPVIDIKF